jgi:hypothetical protein
MVGRGVDASVTVEGPVAGPCQRGNEPSVSKKCGKFLE